MICSICPRGCRIDRSESRGYCGMPPDPVVARAALHFGEEPCISGTRGSGAVFFSGCALRCVYCQNEKISHGGFGKTITVDRLKEIYKELYLSGAHNINLVNPTHFQEAIERSLSDRPPIPIVWNSSGYEKPDSIKRLQGKIEVFLPDLKYLDGDLARRYSGASDYPERAKAAIKQMYVQSPKPVFDSDGLIKRGVVIRHLVLPGLVEKSFDVIDWVRDSFPKGEVLFSLMTQYTPVTDLKNYPEINRTLTDTEYKRVTEYLEYSGLSSGYMQEPGSDGTQLIPDFDLTGV
ncbi:MAG: radical SAM protein [Clostridia bacterium]|nr:radical SAM protein [Clostridia bacterium]